MSTPLQQNKRNMVNTRAPEVKFFSWNKKEKRLPNNTCVLLGKQYIFLFQEKYITSGACRYIIENKTPTVPVIMLRKQGTLWYKVLYIYM